jgi:Spy/CpxP family protein refolding chaperone
MRLTTLLIAVLVGLCCHAASAQEASPAPAQDPIAELVFAPELIMRNQKAIQLTDGQKNAVFTEVKQAQARLIDLQWDLQRAMEPLVELLGQVKVDEKQVMTQLDKVLAAEREVKRTHLMLAVRLKNILTPEQQRALRELRVNAARAGDTTRPASPR